MKNSLFIASLLRVPYSNVEMKERKFDCPNDNLQFHLESVGRNFLDGYHEAISSKDLYSEFSFEKANKLYRGFAFEGAAMGFMMNDLLGFGKKRRIHKIIEFYPEHDYMLHVGAGWAFARIPFSDIEKRINQFDPLLKWLIIDGYGFHQAYFKTKKYVYNHVSPKELKSEDALRAFYQGIGRALWFIFGGQPKKIKEKIECYDLKYASDLWSGVGLASAYAGGVSKNILLVLKDLSKQFYGDLAQGVSFACKARIKANILVPHTEIAAEVLIDCSSLDAANITDDCLAQINDRSTDSSYFLWRKEIKEIFSKKLILC